MRLMIGIGDVAGFSTNLETGFLRNGTNVYFMEIAKHRYSYGSGLRKSFPFLKPVQLAVKFSMRAKVKKQKYIILIWNCIRLLCSIPLTIMALIKFDAFIFLGRSTMLALFDLPLIKLFGKRLLFVFLGSDGRPECLNGKNFLESSAWSTKKLIRKTRIQRREISWIEQWADMIVAHPPAAHYFKKPFIPFLQMGIPVDSVIVEKISYSSSSDLNIPLRILHAPSAPTIKGTALIRQAIWELNEEGVKLQLVELTGVSNETVKSELRRCDFIVDQTYSDSPLPGFAAEAAFYGKPAIIGGYVKTNDLGISKDLMPPSVYVQPELIKNAIRRIAQNKVEMVELGQSAQRFVIEKWNSSIIAKRIESYIKNRFDKQILVDPLKIECVTGFGQDIHTLALRIRTLNREIGLSALGFPNNGCAHAALARLAEEN